MFTRPFFPHPHTKEKKWSGYADYEFVPLCQPSLSLSIKKSNIMLIGSRLKLRNHDLFVTVHDKQLSRVSSVRYLGLHIDENFSWNQHTANIVQRVYSRILCLSRLCPLPADLLARLYCVFCITHIGLL